jgi:tripartite-type tricarboxylate transporter receptor subunit TctC
MARYVPNYVPGNPTIVVENMPGAGTMLAANYVYNVAKPDGLTLGTFDQGVPFGQLFKAEGARFDMTKYAWVGSMASEATIIVLSTDLPYKNVDDLRKAAQPIYLATGGPSAPGYQLAALAKGFIGINFQFVIYNSSPAEQLAVERKEVFGRVGTFTSFKPFLQRGVVRAVLRSRVAEAELQDVPIDEDLTDNKMGKTVMAMRTSSDRVGRPFVAPPKTPAEVINPLHEGFARASRDPGLQAEAAKQMLKVEYTSAEDCVKAMNNIFSQPEEIVKEFGKYVKF